MRPYALDRLQALVNDQRAMLTVHALQWEINRILMFICHFA